jgi:hypothetical protein
VLDSFWFQIGMRFDAPPHHSSFDVDGLLRHCVALASWIIRSDTARSSSNVKAMLHRIDCRTNCENSYPIILQQLFLLASARSSCVLETWCHIRWVTAYNDYPVTDFLNLQKIFF